MDELNHTAPEAELKAAEPKKKLTKSQTVYEVFEEICAVVAIVILLFMFVGRMATVSGESMTNTLQHNDRILMTSFLYTPDYGDIVVIDKETGYYADSLIIKRIIAKEHDTVHIDYASWTVTVNGRTVLEPYVKRVFGPMDREDMTSDTFTVPANCYFVMGDNRNGSTDSRSDHVGFIKESEILGKAIFRLFPLGQMGLIE